MREMYMGEFCSLPPITLKPSPSSVLGSSTTRGCEWPSLAAKAATVALEEKKRDRKGKSVFGKIILVLNKRNTTFRKRRRQQSGRIRSELRTSRFFLLFFSVDGLTRPSSRWSWAAFPSLVISTSCGGSLNRKPFAFRTKHHGAFKSSSGKLNDRRTANETLRSYSSTDALPLVLHHVSIIYPGWNRSKAGGKESILLLCIRYLKSRRVTTWRQAASHLSSRQYSNDTCPFSFLALPLSLRPPCPSVKAAPQHARSHLAGLAAHRPSQLYLGLCKQKHHLADGRRLADTGGVLEERLAG